MAEVVNLRQARKKRERAEKEAKAAANRTKFGRTKAQKFSDNNERTRKARDLDGKRREASPDDDTESGD